MSGKSLKSDLGLFSENLKNVKVPEAFMSTMKNSEFAFDSEIKEHGSATTGQKLASTFAKISKKAADSEAYKTNEARKEKLDNLFKRVYFRYGLAEKYFTECKGIDPIKKFNKKIQNQYKKLHKKGYVNELTEASAGVTKFELDQYGLSFAATEPAEIKKTVQKFNLTGLTYPTCNENENTDYKTRCLTLYSYLRMLFNFCLSYINTTYTDAYEDKNRIKDVEGVQGTFNNAMNKLEDSLKDFNKCASIVDAEEKKHKRYFNNDDNKKQMREIRRSIKTTRRQLETMLFTGKQVTLASEFIFLDEDGKEVYNNLVTTLISINDNLNQIAKYIAKGKYQEFERNYGQILTYFDKLPDCVEKFKTSRKYEKSPSSKKKLELYKQCITDMQKNAVKMQEQVSVLTKEFELAYKEFKNKVIKLAVFNAAGGLAKFALSFTPLGNTGGAFDAFMNDYKLLCRNTELPGLRG